MRKLKKVPMRGITAEELLALWREGKLYQEVNEEDLSQEELLARCSSLAQTLRKPTRSKTLVLALVVPRTYSNCSQMSLLWKTPSVSVLSRG